MKIQNVDRIRASTPVRRRRTGVDDGEEGTNHKVRDTLEDVKTDTAERPGREHVDEYASAI